MKHSSTARKILMIFLVTLSAALLTGCKLSINGHLDGQWQIMEIHYLDDDRTVAPQGKYMSFFLHTVNLTGYGIHGGNMIYDKDNDTLTLDFPQSEPEEIASWGFDSTRTTFSILLLTSSRLVLKSDYAELTLRKY